VFRRSGSSWTQQGAKLTGIGEIGEARFGSAVALSFNGDRALVGGPGDDGGVGAAWAFKRSGSTWAEQGPKLTGAGESGAGRFGSSVALSSQGHTAMIGAPADDERIGAAWVFARSGSTLRQRGAKLLAGGEVGKAGLGTSVALAADGNTALIGAPNNCVGEAWVFTRSGDAWTPRVQLRTGPEGECPTPDSVTDFGAGVALSADASTAVVGDPPLGNNNPHGGFVFARSGSTWAQQAWFPNVGLSAAVSGDGDEALFGAGLDTFGFGVAVFTRSGSAWSEERELEGRFGESVALSADGETALIGGYQANVGGPRPGAVVFER
jgi:hypothetical protein